MNELGIICDIKEGKAKVAIGEMVTDFLSVFQAISNSYAVSFSPLRIGEQVLVLPIRGDLNSGVILRGLYQEKHKAKNTDTNTFNVDFEDGTHLEYNSKTSTLKLNVIKDINITCENGDIKANKNISISCENKSIQANKNINITCENANIKASKVKVDSPSIDLGLGGKGVVTTECICAFTGSVHPHGSNNTRSKI
ncbi:phage baseplate assembly protein V [Campylobacter estrildidarum]|uniref:Phage baseplate assembly protein V n=1 Tax=Campylobacter estrildidarum TaxID=2510189 RepID=A0A4U7BE93_9BACT|nr:phage baseplate assembly protein V [Campylobacter estrildidarum]TKX29509.1 phage baseplate assembly protein V [Campylobacter estrildidarum]